MEGFDQLKSCWIDIVIEEYTRAVSFCYFDAIHHAFDIDQLSLFTLHILSHKVIRFILQEADITDYINCKSDFIIAMIFLD